MGWRDLTVRERRTKVDWATEVAALLDTRYKDCEKIILVCDDLNTHTKSAFYETFEPQRAQEYAKRLQLCYTPTQHALTRQCFSGRRIADLKVLQEETKAWAQDVNTLQIGVDWQMKVKDARVKLKSICPKIKP